MCAGAKSLILLIFLQIVHREKGQDGPAILTIPLKQHQFYDEMEEIEASYDAVKKFVEYNRKRAHGRHLLHIYNMLRQETMNAGLDFIYS